MNLSEFKRIMNGIKDTRKVSFTKHAEERLVQRNINKDEILKSLYELKDLVSVEVRGSDEDLFGQEYTLRFKKLSNYDLVVVITIKAEKVEVVTAYYPDKKKEKRYKEWRDSQK
ncbi:MAG: DUF4258 domain-containing protein [Candidatus Micrarchaeota archaeon]|nr:DUF4258 domain-containing protein [Candidatus Micrarchaeota archaeon]